uniref:Pentatricopeptide repeat-containing protein n=1 Tax=Aegilops tauschii subsp. strangulata TaxID=200361 RepID=A0A453E188_AEGTS
MATFAAAPGRAADALALFRDMLREGVAPDRVTVSTVLNVPASGTVTASLHPFTVKLGLLRSSVVVCNTLLDAYCKHGLLAAGMREGLHREALGLFTDMRRAGLDASQFTFSSMLTVATGMGDLHLGRQVHGLVARATSVHNVFVKNSLLDFYSKCDCLAEMEKLFDEMPERDNVSYNVMISGYAWNRCASRALRLFREMQILCFDRQALPYASLLSVAGSLPHIGIGKQIHAQLVLLGLSSEDLAGNALIDMYSKCGMLDAAKTNFLNKNDKTGVSWTAMITGYVQNGQLEEALRLFCDMRRAGLSPDRATFSSIIKASSSLAMIGLGRQLHSYTIRSGHISSVFSGSALLDMYAKCGCLDEALQTFDEMPERNSISWNAVISAYAHYGQAKNAIKVFEGMLHYGFKPDSVTFLSVLIHGNQDLARVAAEKLFSMGSTDATPYVILSNIYAKAGKWEDAARVKKIMRNRGLRKESGYSWVEVKQKIYSFSSNDQTNPMISEMKEELERLYK